MPAWVLITLLIAAGAAAMAGPILKDKITGTTTIAVSQAILIDEGNFGYDDVKGDIDLANVFVWNGGHAWSVHVELNNGDIFTIDLPIANEADENIAVDITLWADGILGPLSWDIQSLSWFSDSDHNGVLDKRDAIVMSADEVLERDDEVRGPGLVDYGDFTSNHYFMDCGGSYDDNIFTDQDGVSPETIIYDNGNGYLDTGSLSGSGDVVLTPGCSNLAEIIGPYTTGPDAVGGWFFTDNPGGSSGRWNSGEDIYLNHDGDGYYTTVADTLVDADGSSTNAVGSTSFAIETGARLTSFDASDDLYWSDEDLSQDFTTGDALWYDSGDNRYFNHNGESVSGFLPTTDLSDLFDAALDIAFNGGSKTTYYLENSGGITGGTFSTLGLEDRAHSSMVPGVVVEVGSQGKWYIVNRKSGDLDQRSTIELIGNVSTNPDAVKGNDLIKQTPTVTGSTGIFLAGSQTIDADGTVFLSVDDGSGGPVDASTLRGGEVWALDDNGVLGPESIYVIMAWDGNASTSSVEVRGQGSKGLPDNYQFFMVSLADDLSVSSDLDDYYLDSAPDIAAALDNAISAQGSAVYSPTGFTSRYKVDSDDSLASSAVAISNASAAGTNVADDLKLGLLNGGSEALRDLILRGTPTNDVTLGNEIVTSAGERFAYRDQNSNGIFDLGELVYEEETGGALTYSTRADELIYNGGSTDVAAGGPGVLASEAVSLDDDDNVMFWDYDHDGFHSESEPLVDTRSLDLDPGGTLDGGVVVLPRLVGDWPLLTDMDMWRLKDDFDGFNGHHYSYIDNNDNGAYDDGEAIIDQIDGSNLFYLEETDYVIHHGLADLMYLPVVDTSIGFKGNCGGTVEETSPCSSNTPSATTAWTWKTMIPAQTSLGNPLDIRIIIALEDNAPTGVYDIQGVIKPVNY